MVIAENIFVDAVPLFVPNRLRISGETHSVTDYTLGAVKLAWYYVGSDSLVTSANGWTGCFPREDTLGLN